ncbi:UBP1-associated protein 2A [Arabidopsis thaliana]|jgi:heterogeneous nuclear ribonucleoprotein A1/A3|uniref:UBP1-associated protein 2A n=4 Tax=Arabidopsis TaxID=3701 RepID=UBA2A_ARATH|nr:UBP1-associated protein 2A [Arabidopsis thaliana]NP_001190110.1 UBP1-associated protein 2A [Arabidopsis thaliana]NP_001319772.1 UBP1-associated protein 2A [Arabidopsis thaliana]NP_001325969.1 UBP1-associated protein 2A [Arabidopsis thaliana]NP_001325970.1 UBP1-associated protein 2A [Arabidopsis thaliana]NP_001325971.1 UBP1-associated protein 2A [Arabidopsis thaliana]NP_001325972.1 UBP1-associated protein 2A [Arabidopsis thaliana]NP_001325973.1 UBP1-associated protein 2A [Arabidopsis thali|eukprot:NP_001190109.1 UBP1-associated protein 2A [Arabidopsis thaliana]
MTKKRKLEGEESNEAEEPSQKLKQTPEEEQQLVIKNQDNQGDVEEVEYEEVEEEQEEEVEDDDDEDDGDENEDQTDGNRIEAAATSGSGNQEDDDDEPIQDLLEPFSKEQVLSLLKEAAEKHVDVANRIREVADEDPVHRKIFVHGLGWDTKTETLIEAFKQYGEIEDCKAVFDKISGKSKGYGFILYKSRSGARNALKQPQKKIGSRMTACQLASKGPVFGGAPIAAAAVSAPAQHSNSEHTQKKIYVSNVGAELDPQKLLMFFSKFGEIEEGPLGLDKYTGRPKGFCLFVYKSSESAKRALEEPHKTFEGHILHCQKAIDGPKPGKQQQHHHNPHAYNNPRYQRNDNNGYGPPGGHGHLMAGNPAGMGGPTAQVINPAIGQALTALLASQGAGLAFNPAIGQALLGSLGTAAGVNPGNGVGMPTGYGTQAMAPGTMPGYGTQPGLQGGYQTPQPGQGGTSRGQHGVGPYGTPYMGH